MADFLSSLGSDVQGIAGAASSMLQGIGNQITGKAWAPQYNPTIIDPGSASQVSQVENGLLATPQQSTQNILQGTGAASGVANQTGNQQAEQNEQGGGGINGMTQAIGNKAGKNFATSQGKLATAAQFQGQQMANNNVNMATTNAIAMQNAEYNIQSSINNANLAANQARYQTVSGLMQGAGSIGGYGAAKGWFSSSPAGNTVPDGNTVPAYEGGGMGDYGQPGMASGNEENMMGDYGLSGSSASGINVSEE